MAAAKVKGLTIAVLPGTGSIGGALVRKLASAGLSVILGSRDGAKATASAAKASEEIRKPVKGLPLAEAAAAGDVIFWTVSGPLDEQAALLKSLAKPLEGKIIIDTTNVPYLEESAWGQVSSTLLNQEALGVPARWTTAFKSTFSKLISTYPPRLSNPHSVFVAGDDEEAVDITIALVESIPGFKGARAGPLKYTKIVELLGPTWIVLLDKLNSGGSFKTGWRIGE